MPAATCRGQGGPPLRADPVGGLALPGPGHLPLRSRHGSRHCDGSVDSRHACQVVPDALPCQEQPDERCAVNRCSFCNRSADDVEALVTGVGVYICDQCVALSAEAIKNKAAGPKLTTPVWEAVDDDTLLTHLPRIEAIRHQVDDDLRSWVGEARRRGMSWDRIGEALGMRRQSAWERFS